MSGTIPVRMDRMVLDKVDDNELSGLEADEPYKIGKVIAKEGTLITTDEKEYRLQLPLVNDYGLAPLSSADDNQQVLMHYESTISKVKRIKNEIKVLQCCSERSLRHTHSIIASGYNGQLKIQYFITECYGSSIADLQANRPNEKFAKPTCLKLGLVTMKCIQILHECGFIHRDIKPQVFVTGQSKPQEIYFVHFGLARQFRNRDRTHASRRTSLPLFGSIKYVSRNAHKRRDRSRRDDMESWLYMFFEFFDKELLTWTQQKNREVIRASKELFMTEKGFNATTKSCQDIPETFYDIIRYINGMNFTTEPDFHKLRKIIKEELVMSNLKHERYDWLTDDQRAATCTSTSSEDIKSDIRNSGGTPPSESSSP